MAKKPQPKQNLVHDFATEQLFKGKLISEGPEYFTFEDLEGELIDIEKNDSLVSALRTKFNEMEVRKSDLTIEIEYLGEGTRKGGETYDKFAVSVETIDE